MPAIGATMAESSKLITETRSRTHSVSGHMHRYIVLVGQRVAEHALIGFLGSTGRATGPHVHYEILVNGEPQDPEKFIGLARLIPIADGQITGKVTTDLMTGCSRGI